jgi:DNA-binding PadR family transcriptional regulator
MLRDFLLGFVRIHILHHTVLEAQYGLALIEELRHHGYRLGAGTVYPLLHALEADGLLVRELRTVGGRVRKYYRATPAGRRVLAGAREKIAELVSEVLEGQGPRSLRARPAPSACRRQSQKAGGHRPRRPGPSGAAGRRR